MRTKPQPNKKVRDRKRKQKQQEANQNLPQINITELFGENFHIRDFFEKVEVFSGDILLDYSIDAKNFLIELMKK